MAAKPRGDVKQVGYGEEVLEFTNDNGALEGYIFNTSLMDSEIADKEGIHHLIDAKLSILRDKVRNG